MNLHEEVVVSAVTREAVERQLRQLSPDKLSVVAEFVAFLAARSEASSADQAMKASEEALREYWDSPEEDEAWAHL
jgi:hypothetical protein